MKKVTYKSAMPIYIAAAVWLLAGLIFPKFLLGFGGLIVTAALSAAAWFVSKRFFPDRTVEVKEKITTGDPKLDAEIAQGVERLMRLQQANDAIDHPEMDGYLDRMVRSGEQIFRDLVRDPKDASVVRRFMSYYLPTAEKLMDEYQNMMKQGTKGENINTAMAKTENAMGVIADAFDKCADQIFSDNEMDIDTDISVLKTLLTGDDLLKNGTNTAFRAAREAPNGEDGGIKLTLGGK